MPSQGFAVEIVRTRLRVRGEIAGSLGRLRKDSCEDLVRFALAAGKALFIFSSRRIALACGERIALEPGVRSWKSNEKIAITKPLGSKHEQ